MISSGIAGPVKHLFSDRSFPAAALNVAFVRINESALNRRGLCPHFFTGNLLLLALMGLLQTCSATSSFSLGAGSLAYEKV